MHTFLKSFIVITILTSILGLSYVMPSPSALAQGTNTTTTTAGPTLPNPIGVKIEDGKEKPINLLDVMLRVMQIALAAVDIFALFMFILGGFELLISAGNPERIKKAKDTLVWATLGILVITLSYSILKFIFEEVKKGFGS